MPPLNPNRSLGFNVKKTTRTSHYRKMDGTMDGTMALRIMGVLRSEPSATMDNLSNTLGIPRRTLVRYMNRLQEDNKIKRVGGRRYGHWEISKEG